MTHLFATCGLLWVLSRKNFIPGKTPMDLLKEKIDEQKKDIKVSVCSGNVVELLSETLEEDTVKEAVFEAMRRLDTGDPSRLVSFSNEMGGEPQSAATEKKEEKGSVKATFGKGKAKEKREETTKTDGEECSDEEPEEAGRHSLSDLMNKVNAMRANLKENVIGQHYAVNAFTGGYFGMELLADVDKKRKGPRGIFLFAGPPGVGKTYMAELSTFGTDIPFLRVDMSEYADKSGISNFNGIHSSYSNAHPGVVTKFVSEHPHSLLLFDEIEKACPEIIHLFLQILDAGTLQDMKWEKEISFKDTIIIFTTNAGHNLYEDVTRTNLSGISSKTVINALQSDVDPKTGRPFFPGAIISRIAKGTVIMFNHLEPGALCDIVAKEIRHTLTEFENAYGVHTELDEGLLAAAVLYREGGKADARSLKGAAGNFVRKELLTLFSLCQTDGDGKKTDNVKNIRFSLDIDGADEAAKALFRESATVNGLLFCSEDRAAEIQKQAVVGVNLTFTDNLEDLKKLLRGDISFLLVDVTTHQNEDETVPADLEDLTSDGINAFHFAAEYYEELPIYILAPDDIHSDANTYTSFISAGAKDIVEFKRDDDKVFIRQMESLRRSAMIANGAYRLARSNNVLTFNSAQYFSEDGSEAEIVLRRLRVVRSVDAEDNQTIVSSVGLPGVTFDDIIGSKEAKNSLKEFAEYLKNPRAYLVKGVRAPRGVLLYGAPGTGKTMLAKALAGESGIAFIQKNGTEFFKKYVGEGPQAIRDLFRTARRYAPAVIFVDEVDSFAKMRTGGESERPAEALLNTFLSEMDGFVYDEKRPVFVLVATNFGIDPGSGNKVLDPAFVRRFDRKIKIELPDTEEREAFIRYYLSKHGVGGISDGAIHSLAVRSYGRSPADLEMVVEYALRLAGTEPLTDAVLSKSLDADRFGEEHIWKPETVLQTTYHEAGHTVISWLCGQKPSYVTNISRGGYGGYMLPEIDDTSFGKTKQQLLDDICCSLGGRAAEYVIYGEEKGNSTGASSDLQHATQIAKEILTAYCMDDNLVVMNDLPTYGELGKTFYEKINETVKTQFARAIGLLTENREALEALTKTIMEKNSLTQEEILTVLSPFKH